MKIKHLILKLIFPLLFFQSLSSYPYHFKRLYRAKDDTTIDLISDCHADCGFFGGQVILEEAMEQYTSIFSELKTSLADNLKVFWESYNFKSHYLKMGRFFEKNKEYIQSQISGKEMQDLFDSTCLYVSDFKEEAICPTSNMAGFLPAVAFNLEKHGIEIIDSSSYRRDRISFIECFRGDCSISEIYSMCFWSFKINGDKALDELGFKLEQKKQDSEHLQGLYYSFCDYKIKVLRILKELECEKYFVCDGDFEQKNQQLKALDLIFKQLSNCLIIDLVDFEMLFKMLSLSAKRKILYAGGVHCNNITKYLVSQCGFCELINLGSDMDVDFEAVERGEKTDSEVFSKATRENFRVSRPTFRKGMGDMFTRYFSFAEELDFEILQHALLEDPSLSYAKWLEAQKGSGDFWQEVQERIAKKRFREDSEEAQGREVKRPRAEEEQKSKRGWCVIS